MKTKIISYKLIGITLLILFHLQVFGKVEKEKKISRNYKVSSSTELRIDNRFGRVHIDTWDKDEIDIVVSILVDKRTEKDADRMLERIDVVIDDSDPDRLISFKTTIGSGGGGGSDNFRINYQVSMPKNNNLDLENKHGEIYLADINGRVRIKMEHGRIKTENMTGRVNINLSFGDGRIKSIGGGSMEIRHFGRLTVGSLGDVSIDAAHSNMDIESGERVEIYAQHGTFSMGKLNYLSGKFAHSDLEIDEINRSLELQTQHMDLEVRKVGKDFELVDLSGSFSDFDISLDKNVSCTIEARLQFGDVSYKESEIDFNYVVKEMNSSVYKGTLGSSTKQGRFKVKTTHGDLRIGLVD